MPPTTVPAALLLLSGLACCIAISFDAAGNGVEPASNTLFPMRMGSAELAGMGVRVKKIVFVSVQVYSVGLYLDKSTASEFLTSYASQPKYSEDSNLYNAIMGDDLGKTLRLVMVRTVTGDQMGSALSEAIKSRLTPGNEAAFDQFKRMFSMPGLKTGTEIKFAYAPGGTLTTSIDGKDVGVISSKPLSKALFDIFLGENAVLDRKVLVERLATILGS